MLVFSWGLKARGWSQVILFPLLQIRMSDKIIIWHYSLGVGHDQIIAYDLVYITLFQKNVMNICFLLFLYWTSMSVPCDHGCLLLINGLLTVSGLNRVKGQYIKDPGVSGNFIVKNSDHCLTSASIFLSSTKRLWIHICFTMSIIQITRYMSDYLHHYSNINLIKPDKLSRVGCNLLPQGNAGL